VYLFSGIAIPSTIGVQFEQLKRLFPLGCYTPQQSTAVETVQDFKTAGLAARSVPRSFLGKCHVWKPLSGPSKTPGRLPGKFVDMWNGGTMSNFLGALRGMFFYLTNKTYSFPGFSSTSYGFTWCSRELRSPSKTPKASLSSNAFGTAVNHHVPSFSFIKKLSTCALHIHIYIYTFLHLGIRCECKYIYIYIVSIMYINNISFLLYI